MGAQAYHDEWIRHASWNLFKCVWLVVIT